jgi:hypothetical protein
MRRVFNFILESNPEVFLHWIANELPHYDLDLLWNEEEAEVADLPYWKPGAFSMEVNYVAPYEDWNRTPYFFYLIDVELMDNKGVMKTFKNAVEVEVREIRTNRIQAICQCVQRPEILEFLSKMKKEIDLVFTPAYVSNDTQQESELSVGSKKPILPHKPVDKPRDNPNAWNEWFNYYHEMQRTGHKITLEQIANDIYYSYGYVRQKHSRYIAEHNT